MTSACPAPAARRNVESGSVSIIDFETEPRRCTDARHGIVDDGHVHLLGEQHLQSDLREAAESDDQNRVLVVFWNLFRLEFRLRLFVVIGRISDELCDHRSDKHGQRRQGRQQIGLRPRSSSLRTRPAETRRRKTRRRASKLRRPSSAPRAVEPVVRKSAKTIAAFKGSNARAQSKRRPAWATTSLPSIDMPTDMKNKPIKSPPKRLDIRFELMPEIGLRQKHAGEKGAERHGHADRAHQQRRAKHDEPSPPRPALRASPWRRGKRKNGFSA